MRKALSPKIDNALDVGVVSMLMMVGLLALLTLPHDVGLPIMLTAFGVAVAMVSHTKGRIDSEEARAHHRRVELKLDRIAAALEAQPQPVAVAPEKQNEAA